MKTYHIKDLLKKEVLIIELPKVCDYDLYVDKIYIYDHEEKTSKSIKGSYTLLGKPDEIKESDAMELVGEGFNISTNKKVYNDYKDDCNCFKTATESLLSAIESVIFWDVNPMSKPKKTNLNSSFFERLVSFNDEVKFDEADLRTFDRNRSIILVKNSTPKI